jgi:L-ribulose-5-phosphate 3-epimerase
VPAVVNPETGYQDAWTRSQKVIRERILPLASELKVIVGIEEVWNKFLLSPLELNKYVDEFASPWVRAYVDVGNMFFYGYPQDWIRTVGKRAVRLHLKDFKLDRPNGKFEWKNLGEGDIDWPEVRKALTETGYQGWATVELSGGDAGYLKDVSARFDRFLAGEKPVAAGA